MAQPLLSTGGDLSDLDGDCGSPSEDGAVPQPAVPPRPPHRGSASFSSTLPHRSAPRPRSPHRSAPRLSGFLPWPGSLVLGSPPPLGAPLLQSPPRSAPLSGSPHGLASLSPAVRMEPVSLPVAGRAALTARRRALRDGTGRARGPGVAAPRLRCRATGAQPSARRTPVSFDHIRRRTHASPAPGAAGAQRRVRGRRASALGLPGPRQRPDCGAHGAHVVSCFFLPPGAQRTG